MFKYEYIGDDPMILMQFHIEVKKGDVITVEQPIENALFILVEDKKKSKEAIE